MYIYFHLLSFMKKQQANLFKAEIKIQPIQYLMSGQARNVTQYTYFATNIVNKYYLLNKYILSTYPIGF